MAEYEFVTPAYLGGPRGEPEWRLASFVHVLRWWWRALAWSWFGGDLRSMKIHEALLFGWAEQGFGSKRIAFRDCGKQEKKLPQPWDDGTDILRHWSGISYLSARGLDERKPLALRRFAVSLHIDWRKTKSFSDWWKQEFPRDDEPNIGQEKALRILRDALVMMGLIGGLGSRSRRGFGSLAIRALTADGKEEKFEIEDVDGYLSAMRKYWPSSPDDLPPFTTLSPKSYAAVIATGPDPRVLFNYLGVAFQYFRNWGQSGAVGHVHGFSNGKSYSAQIPAGSRKAGYQFARDHEWYMTLAAKPGGMADCDAKTYAPRRAVLGLPHNYAKLITVSPEGTDRRASPLFLHIHKLTDELFAATVAILPSEFLPGSGRLQIGGTQSYVDGSVGFTPDWSVLSGFVASLESGEAHAAISALSPAFKDVIVQKGFHVP